MVEIAVQSLVFFLALSSNSLVLVALVRQLRRKPMSRMYRFMYHLSIADLLVALLNILPQIIWDITFRYKRKHLPAFPARFVITQGGKTFVICLGPY